MNYTLNQLQIFLKVVQTQSVTRASEELHLTQPAVSIQLKNFQDQFDIPLIEMVGRRIYITDFGMEIAEAAENIINQINTINSKTLAYKGQLIGRLKVSVVSTGKYIMPYFLSDFVSKHTGVDLYMDVTNKTKVLESLENNEVDFALLSIPTDHVHLDRLDLLQNKLYLVGKSTCTIAPGTDIQDFFHDIPLIFREKGSGTRLTMERFLEQNRISILKKMELTSNEAVKQAVIAGLGYSIMPLIGIKNEILNGDLKIISVEGFPITTMWSLVWLKRKKLNPVSLAYLDYLKNNKAQIAQNQFGWYERY